jgi:hypothetical protein
VKKRQPPEVRKNVAPLSPRDGDDVASRVVAGGGEARTSPEMGTTRLVATSPAEARKRALGGWVQVLGFRRCKRSLEGRSADRNLAGDGDDAAGHGVVDGGEEEILGFRVPTSGGGKSCRRLRVPAAEDGGAAGGRGRSCLRPSKWSRRRYDLIWKKAHGRWTAAHIADRVSNASSTPPRLEYRRSPKGGVEELPVSLFFLHSPMRENLYAAQSGTISSRRSPLRARRFL